jgi:hypothetical protein
MRKLYFGENEVNHESVEAFRKHGIGTRVCRSDIDVCYVAKHFI